MADSADRDIFLLPGDALSVTDIQNDFLSGGSLGVPDGNQIIAPLNRVIELFRSSGLPLFYTRDWHPPDHCSFIAQGGSWPPHCIRDTSGAAFAAGLNIPPGAIVISKGTHKDSEQYSTIYGRDAAGRTQSELMKNIGVSRIFISGLATDYCVLNSVRDARAEGFEVFVLADAIRAVNVHPGDAERAVAEIIRLGAQLTVSDHIRVKK